MGVLVAAVLAGCESVRSDLRAGMKEKIEGPTYRLHYVSADARVHVRGSPDRSGQDGVPL
jgi:hypothetical protein